MSAEKILKTIEEKGYKFVDLRFCDTMGKEQHVSLPVAAVDEDLFEEGKMFDGSSISGWKGINESDMVLMPDISTAIKDPFAEHKTMIIRCDVLEPNTMEGYNRCPRSLAKRAEAYLKASGIADTAFFGPEPEFFVFDDVRFDVDMHGCSYRVDSEEGAWNTGAEYEGGNIGHRPGVKGGYFPVHHPVRWPDQPWGRQMEDIIFLSLWARLQTQSSKHRPKPALCRRSASLRWIPDQVTDRAKIF